MMANAKISELPAATALAGDELLPGVQDSGNVAVTARQVRQLSEFGRPPLIAFAGDSIASLTGELRHNSPWFWAQVKQPRLYTWNNKTWDGSNDGYMLARSGSHSGSHTGFAGSDVFGTGDPDMNMPSVIAAAQAVAPDILFIEVGTNDSGATLNETFANVKAFVEAVDAPHTILCSILPRTQDGNTFGQTNALYRRWATLNPRVHFLDFTPALLDDTSGTFGPIGGNGTAAGAYTVDGLHPGPFGARAMAPYLDALLEELGVPKCDYIATGQTRAYNASSQPYGNLVGSRGAMGGTGGTHSNANSTGDVATGWIARAPSDGSITVVASKGTIEVDGKTVTAQVLTMTATAALSSAQSVTLLMQNGGWVQPSNGYPNELSAIVELRDLVGCRAVKMTHSGANGGLGADMGAVYSGTYDASVGGSLLPTVTEVLKYRFPGTVASGTSGAGSLSFEVSFPAGVEAGELGSVAIAQVGAWPVPPTV